MNTKCELCGEPMPPGEEMFKYHGFSSDCPKPPLPPPPKGMNERRETVTGTVVVTDSVLPLARALRIALLDLYEMQAEINSTGLVTSDRYARTMDQARAVLANTTSVVEQPVAALLKP